MDEARELATYADQFSPWEETAPGDIALRGPDADAAYEVVVPQRDWPRGVRVHTTATTLGPFLTTTGTADFLRACLALWAADGSVVLSRGEAPANVLEERSRTEGAVRSPSPENS
jgi:hypothetical protein